MRLTGIISQHRALAITLGLAIGTAYGCAMESEEEAEQLEVSEAESALTIIQAPGPLNQPGERQLTCPARYAVVGFGGRVGDDNLTDLSLVCKRINDDGSLSQETGIFVGGQSQEVKVKIPENTLAYAFGVTVTEDNVRQVGLRWCQWNQTTRSLNLSNCGIAATPSGTTRFEREQSVRTRAAGVEISFAEAQRRVLVGLGFGVRGDNVVATSLWYGNILP